MRRDPASLYWWGAMAVAVASFFGGVATLIINGSQTNPSQTWTTVGWIALIGGIGIGVIAGGGLIHVGLENMGYHFRLRLPVRWPVSWSKTAETEAPPLTLAAIREAFKEVHAEAHPVVAGTAPPTAPAPKPSPPPTGETVIKSVISSFVMDINAADKIDYYYKDPSSKRYWVLRELIELTFGEIALVRRLAVADQRTEEFWKCTAALENSGIKIPSGSLTRLQGKGLIEVLSTNVRLTDLGFEHSWAFTQLLTHYPALVTAYRAVTPAINRAVMFVEGRKPG